MIRLHSKPSDEALRDLAAARTRFDLASPPGAEPQAGLLDGYRTPAVKEAILSETAGKCAYCESKIRHVYFGDIEHILPKAHVPDRAYDYANLTLACAVCNNHKRDYYDPANALIDPYTEEPSEHLLAAGPVLFRQPGSMKGRLTIGVIELNRPELIDRRRDRLEALLPLLDQYVTEADPNIRKLLGIELHREAEDDREFAFIVRAYLAYSGHLEWPRASG